PSLVDGTSFQSTSLPAVIFSENGSLQPNVTTRVASRTSFSATTCGFHVATSNPSLARLSLTCCGISGSGLIPRALARYGGFLCSANWLKCAAAITLFADPCSQTNRTV